MSDKPLGQKAYGHIAHLPGSRMGPGDHSCHPGQARIATERTRDRHDQVWVQEKLDGSCVSVARIEGELVPLTRAGYRAVTSPYYQHILWDGWVRLPAVWERFDALLGEGERVVGEWLAQAHGTRYDLTDREPFVAFDLMRGGERTPYEPFRERIGVLFHIPPLLAMGPTSIEAVVATLGRGCYGALEPIEGAVWRVERKGKVDFLCKYVRPDKVDGIYLDSVTGGEPVWNWQPECKA